MVENNVCFGTNFPHASVRCLEDISDAQGASTQLSFVLICVEKL